MGQATGMTALREGERLPLKALEAESVGQNVRPFRRLLGGLAKEAQKAAGKKVRVRAKQPTKRPRISGAH